MLPEIFRQTRCRTSDLWPQLGVRTLPVFQMNVEWLAGTGTESAITATFCEIARKVAAKIAMRGRDFSARFPKIVVQNT